MSLEEAFQEVHGIGEEKAKELVGIVEAKGPKGDTENVEQALDYLEEDRPGYAAKFLRRELE